LFAQLVVASMQQIEARVALYPPQYNESYEINAFDAEMFLKNFHGHLTLCPLKALNVVYDNLFRNQLAFTVFEIKVFKYNF